MLDAVKRSCYKMGMNTVREFVSSLGKMPFEKPFCFCGDPTGLTFYRFKVRGEKLLQLEFDEPITRSGGRIRIDAVTPPPRVEELNARTVGSLFTDLRNPDLQGHKLVFGGDHDVLHFTGMRDLGEWVSIDFKERVYRDEDGGFVVEEEVDGRLTTSVFPVVD